MQVSAPCDGEVLALKDVKDPTFADQLVGPGVGIEPPDGRQLVVAPADGMLLKLDPHAFILLVDGAVGVLVHVGINTVQLKGEGFEVLAEQGSTVTAGTPIVEWDPAAITADGMERTVLVVLMDQPPDTTSSDVIGGYVRAGEPLFRTI